MSQQHQDRMDAKQLIAMRDALHQGSVRAAEALATWIDKPAVIEIGSLEQLPLEEAVNILDTAGNPICFCAVEISGLITGQMILAFDDASGLALADLLLDRPVGASRQWSEMETSAAIETTNILCCWYLNALSSSVTGAVESTEILPSPPVFARDFAESLMQFALMGQAVAGQRVVLARTKFRIGGLPVNWTLLLIPDAESMSRLPRLLSATVTDSAES